MKTSKAIAFALLSTLCGLYSCSKKDSLSTPELKDPPTKTDNLKKIVQLHQLIDTEIPNEIRQLHRGKSISVLEGKIQGNVAKKVSTETLYSDSPIKEEANIDDLKNFGFSSEKIFDYFKNYYGVIPDGIAISKDYRGNGSTHKITERWNYMAYKKTSGIRLLNETSKDLEAKLAARMLLINKDTFSIVLMPNISRVVSNQANWTVNVAAGLSFKKTLEVPYFSGDYGFNISITVGFGGSETQTFEVSARAQIKVPPLSKQRLYAYVFNKSKTWDYEIPITVEGFVGVNFPCKVYGHYFWFHNLSSLLGNAPNATEKGTISVNNYSSFYIVCEKAELLDEPELAESNLRTIVLL